MIYILLGVLLFLVFAWDIENDRDFWTWLWLLDSILWFVISILLFIKSDY